MATVKERVLDYLRAHPEGADDDELTLALELSLRQHANQACRDLAAEGLVERRQVGGKIRNFVVGSIAVSAPASAEMKGFGAPFDRMFRDAEEANWAFDLLQDTAEKLAIRDENDPRWAVICIAPGSTRRIRFNYGPWLVMDIIGQGGTLINISIALETAEYPQASASTPFKQTSDREFRIYTFPIDDFRPLSTELRAAIDSSLKYIADRFGNWRASPRRGDSQAELVSAILNASLRPDLLQRGLHAWNGTDPVPDAPEEAISEEAADRDSSQPQDHFTKRTFELLLALHNSPHRGTYQSEQEDYRRFVEVPLKGLLTGIAPRLPRLTQDVLETHQNLFSRFLKNDFGQGGAWDFYWGAFYPRGGRRTEDAQLFVSINHERLEYGFSVGAHGGSSGDRLMRNCARHLDHILELLDQVSAIPGLCAVPRNNTAIDKDHAVQDMNEFQLNDWLRDPRSAGFTAHVIIPRDEVLATPFPALQDHIAAAFSYLFPLVLLATRDDPIPEIQQYVGWTDTDETKTNPAYPLVKAAEDLGVEQSQLETWVSAIRRKGQAVFYGPPGTGKTYIARKLAAHFIGEGDGISRIVQFHPAYAYEDFIQGLRPRAIAGGVDYPMVKGRFVEFCEQARLCQGDCVLIIDEINRANLARVFGELMYLLEYRDDDVPLAGGERAFSIPKNVLIIGTMNTADRSIALVDHALRRRFAFLHLRPNYKILQRYHEREQTGFATDRLIAVLEKLNDQIGDANYSIGVSFFLRQHIREELPSVWETEIEPYLEEQFFDQPDKIESFRWKAIAGQVMS